jgi:TolB-like protein
MNSIKFIVAAASILIIFGLISCTPTGVQVKKPPLTQKKTPRFSDLNEAVDYLGTAIGEEMYNIEGSNQFTSDVSGDSYSSKEPLTEKEFTPEEMTRQHAESALDELDREIARKEGKSISITSKESYTSQQSTNMGGTDRASKEPMVIAIADFINEEGNVSKLGRYVSDKITPYFARSKQFSVMERVVIDKVLEEHQFQVSAFVDEESTQEFGKLVGAETIISGTISALDDAFYFNAKVVGVAHGNLITSIDVEVDRSGRLVALYNANLPRIKEKEFKSKIFRAKGLGIPSVKHKKNPTLARTLAGRAATVDAMRNLAQQIQGAHIDAKTTVKDFMTESDNVTLKVNTYIRGARVISKKEMPDGAVEVEMEVELPAEFFEKLSANQ